MKHDYKFVWRMSDAYWSDLGLLETTLDKLDGLTEEMALFIAEPTTYGYFPLEDVAKKCDAFREAARVIRARGLRVGINLWPTFGAEEVYQADAVKRVLPFPAMVDKDGRVAKRVACPASPEFLAYAREKFRLCAKAEPDFIWIDDDCRFTHLGALSYPCFCDSCVAGFAGGRFKSREKLVEALNAPENRDLRRAWSHYGAQRLAAYCRAAREAVDEVNPAIDTPFMTVGYTHTTFSGDYIQACMEAARSRAGRPGHGYYRDGRPREIFEKAMDAARQVLRYSPEAQKDAQYEEESCPGTPLNKAVSLRLIELSLSIWAGCNGVAFNHLFSSGGARPMDHMARECTLLRAYRPFYDRYAAFAAGLPALGVWDGSDDFLMARMPTAENGWFDEENPAYDVQKIAREWATNGVAITPDKAHAFATALQGRIADCYTDEEIASIFKKPVLLDGESLGALEKRGLSALAGARVGGRLSGAWEVLTDDPLNGAFAGATRTTISEACYELVPTSEDTRVLSLAASALGGDAGAGATLYKRAATLGYSPYSYTDTPGKRAQMNAILREMGAPVIVDFDDPYAIGRVSPWARGDETRCAVLLVNASTDAASPFGVLARGAYRRATLLTPGEGEQTLPVVREGDMLRARVRSMTPWGMAVVLFERDPA